LFFHNSIEKKADSIVITLKVHPKSSVQKIDVSQESIDVFLRSPPEKGKANKELIKFLSKLFEVSSANISILSGKTSKIKIISISNYKKEVIEKLFS